jgi:tetratricopeptide (TPR) repeat protein
MRASGLVIAVLICAAPCAGADFDDDLLDATTKAQKITERINSPQPRTPAESEDLRRQKNAAIGEISKIADKRPDNPEAQLAVGKSLASVEEAPRAIPYAERGLKLAQTSGDPKLIRTALLTGSEIYYKAGNYEMARTRALTILKDSPHDKDALALYMQVKDRGAASAGGAGGSKTSAAGSGAANAGSGTTAAQTAAAPRAPGVAMTSAASLESQKQLASGMSLLKLDPKAALKNFDAAVAADAKSAAARVERSKARLETGDAKGALADADDAVALEPGLGEAYAARADANRALGKREAELLEDYEKAAKLDPHFGDAYASALLRANDARPSGNDAAKEALRRSAAAAAAGGVPGSEGPSGLLSRSPKGWGLLALLAGSLGCLGGLIVPLVLKRRRSGEDGSLPR